MIDISEYNAIQKFNEKEPENDENRYYLRCWIHKHPRFKAYMSSTDLFQLYLVTKTNKRAFGIVISPRDEGPKALCVRLTKSGFKTMEKLFSDAEKEKVNAFEYVTSHIHGLSDLYCQFDFRVTDDPCTVVICVQRKRLLAN